MGPFQCEADTTGLLSQEQRAQPVAESVPVREPPSMMNSSRMGSHAGNNGSDGFVYGPIASQALPHLPAGPSQASSHTRTPPSHVRGPGRANMGGYRLRSASVPTASRQTSTIKPLVEGLPQLDDVELGHSRSLAALRSPPSTFDVHSIDAELVMLSSKTPATSDALPPLQEPRSRTCLPTSADLQSLSCRGTRARSLSTGGDHLAT